MPKFAANLSMMYTEYPFLDTQQTDRFAAAAADGFVGIEFLFPYDFAPEAIKDRLDKHGLSQVLFNCPPGDWVAGERGLACLPGRENEFKRGIETALAYADVLGNRCLHVMAGLLPLGQSRDRYQDIYLSNLAYAAQQAASHGITILIEPINTRDMPGYFLYRQEDAHAICQQIGAANVKVQFDIYHCQIMQGDLASTMSRDIAGIGHIQIAGVPGRHEPDQGEINYPYLFNLMDELDYAGWVGCEYRPLAGTSAGLGWLNPWLLAKA
ncbi:MAG: 2-oxo-tetronate isomerase [Pseudomonadota bacterium]